MANQGSNNNDPDLSITWTADKTEVVVNDAWTARILVGAVAVGGIYGVKSLATLLGKNPEVLQRTLELALQGWGKVVGVTSGSLIVDLDCGSQEKYSKFVKDFDGGKVQVAMEKEFSEIGYEKLQLALKKRDVAVMEMSKESVVRETKKITFVNPNPDTKQFQSEVKEDPQGTDKPNKEDLQLPSQKRTQASHSTEVKQEEESGSAAKKSKLDPVRELGTSGVSSTSKTMKGGIVTDDDLEKLGKAIGNKWDRLGRRLPGIVKDEIEDIEERYKSLSQKGYHILNLWKTNNGEAADYETLHDALVHELVKRKDLAEKYCFEK